MVKMPIEIDSRKVFVVHGRNLEARKAIFSFLRSIGLDPIEWAEARLLTGKPTPYVGEILEAGFSVAQAVLILFTPDDEAQLLEPLRNPDDERYETELTPQARPNVIFEAGMAMAMFRDRTILVSIGALRPISDISGLHFVRMSNSLETRQDLAERLEDAGCAVNLKGKRDWHTEGNFDLLLFPQTQKVKRVKENEIVNKKALLDEIEIDVSRKRNIQGTWRGQGQERFLDSESPKSQDTYNISMEFQQEGARITGKGSGISRSGEYYEASLKGRMEDEHFITLTARSISPQEFDFALMLFELDAKGQKLQGYILANGLSQHGITLSKVSLIKTI